MASLLAGWQEQGLLLSVIGIMWFFFFAQTMWPALDFLLFHFVHLAYHEPPLSIVKAFVIVKVLLKAQRKPPRPSFSFFFTNRSTLYVIVHSTVNSQHMKS